MSKYQLGWNRSYRQALELVARDHTDVMAAKGDMWAEARLHFIAELWQCRNSAEVLDDLAQLRRDGLEFMRRLEEGK